LIKSDPKNDVIPLTDILLSRVDTLSVRVWVWAVDTIGDWIKLSIASKHLAFWFVAMNLWEVPIPTLSSSMAIGILLRAFSAVDASLIDSSVTLITNKSWLVGRNSVLPSPAKLVVAIPIDDVIPPFLS